MKWFISVGINLEENEINAKFQVIFVWYFNDLLE